MYIELHLLQSFAPSNLNRDENGAPKNCVFGGATRARISSQCLKRATREEFKRERLLPRERLAERTKLAVGAIADQLAARGRDRATAGAVATVALGGLGLTVKEDDKTEYLLFLGQEEIVRLAQLCDQHWDALTPLIPTTPTAAVNEAAGEAAGENAGDETSARGSGRGRKDANKGAVPAQITQALSASLDGGKAADLALFGRMIADKPGLNIEAACQVAHAISTHPVVAEFDFYTAVDDLQPNEETGAGMMGTVEFNSACFYRYANVDVEQLTRNLGGDRALAMQAIEAYIRASVSAVPSGKQNSMAAQNPPSLVMAVARERGLWSLANAFEAPVRPREGSGLIEQSTLRLDAQWGKIARMYGEGGIRGVWVACDDLDGGAALTSLAARRVASLGAIIAGVRAALSDGGAA